MKRFLLLLVYYSLFPVFLLASLPAYLLKMRKRGGIGTGMRERFSIYKTPRSDEPQQGLYIHAVSVGETMIALKFIREWRLAHDEPVVLAVSTPTGHQVARQAGIQGVRITYAPLDLPILVERCLTRFSPRAVVLIEAELWPHFAQCCHRRNIPMLMLNARLSYRSEGRYKRVRGITRLLFERLSALAVQNENDRERFIGIGASAAIIQVTGSIKFDVLGDAQIAPREDFRSILDALRQGKPVVLAASTHVGEERVIARAIREAGAFPLIIPRHEERREQVLSELTAEGFRPLLRSQALSHEPSAQYDCYVADTTGEMRDWTQLADAVIIGKSFLSKGGQNPVEAIAARVPVITGPHMQNFHDLVQLLQQAGGICEATLDDLASQVKNLLDDSAARETQIQNALTALLYHSGATGRSVRVVETFYRKPR